MRGPDKTHLRHDILPHVEVRAVIEKPLKLREEHLSVCLKLAKVRVALLDTMVGEVDKFVAQVAQVKLFT